MIMRPGATVKSFTDAALETDLRCRAKLGGKTRISNSPPKPANRRLNGCSARVNPNEALPQTVEHVGR
jgi:hypothetical protein